MQHTNQQDQPRQQDNLQKFPLGQTLATRGINALIEQNPYFARFAQFALRKHATGDWGDCCEEDAEQNDEAINNGTRIFSVYNIPDAISKTEDRIWIITEADRSATTVLFPREY